MKLNTVANLAKENPSFHDNLYIPWKEELCGTLYDNFENYLLFISLILTFNCEI